MALPNGDLITTVFDPQMAYPVDKRMQVDTLNSRDSMSMFIRWEGMEVYVLENSKKYILQGGRSNEFWKENGTGTGTGGTTFVGQFESAGLLPTSGRSAGDYAFVGTGDDFVQYNWDNIANQWVMAEGQTDMASEFFHIGYKTPLRRPVIFPLLPKDVLVQESGDFVFAPETAVARFIFTGEVTAIRGIETAAADREIKLVNRTGSDIPLRDKATGIPSGSGFDFGGTDYVWFNGSEITLKGNGTYWGLAPNNQVAFSDHLDSVNAQVSVGSDGLMVITGVNDTFTGEIVSFKEIDYTPSIFDGNVFTKFNNINVKRVVKSINYAMFGAKGNGVNDDAVQIKLAHQVANLLNIPVINEEGEYWLINPNNIIIKTDTNWGKTIFHIDESKNSGTQRFTIQRSQEPVDITLTSGQKSSFLSKLKPGVDVISELSTYNNCLVKVLDTNDIIGKRNGVGTGWPKMEYFFVEDGGRVINDIYWDLSDYTLLQAFPADADYLNITGGIFKLNGLDNPSQTGNYVNNGITINRSRTKISNQSVQIDGSDNATYHLNGFYIFSHTYDCSLNGVRVTPRIYKGVAGTYGIGGGNINIETKFNDITSEGSEEFSSSVGTNNMKDFRVRDCTLNRIDVHFNSQNLYVDDCKLGYIGISVSGSGDLHINNTTVNNEFFVTFRQDYGGTWDGDIRITNSKLKLYRDRFASILQFWHSDLDFNIPIASGRRIALENIEIDYSLFPYSENSLYAFYSTMGISAGNRIKFPSYVSIKDIKVLNREKGIKAMPVPITFGSYICDATGDYNNINCVVEIENTLLDRDDSIPVENTLTYLDDYSPFVSLEIKNPKEVSLFTKNFRSNIRVSNANVRAFDLLAHQGNVSYIDCIMAPIKPSGSQRTYYAQNTNPDITYINCEWDLPSWQGNIQTNPSTINNIYGDTINLNSFVKGNHILSRLSAGVLATFTARVEFLDMLKTHLRFENEAMLRKWGTTAQRPELAPDGFNYFDTDLGLLLNKQAGAWISNLVVSNGSRLNSTDGNQLIGTRRDGAITKTAVSDSGTGFPQYWGEVVTFNGSTLNRTWSIFKSIVSSSIYTQTYDNLGVGQGWQRVDGATTFPALTDTPANYTGHKNTSVKVNNEETALVFVADGVEVRNITDGGSISTALTSGFMGSRLSFTASTAVTLQGFQEANGQSSLTLVNPHATNNLTVVHNGSGTVKYIDPSAANLVVAPKTAVRLEIVGNEMYRVL